MTMCTLEHWYNWSINTAQYPEDESLLNLARSKIRNVLYIHTVLINVQSYNMRTRDYYIYQCIILNIKTPMTWWRQFARCTLETRLWSINLVSNNLFAMNTQRVAFTMNSRPLPRSNVWCVGQRDSKGWPLPTVETEANGDPSWLARWACCASTRDFCPAFASLVGPEQNIFLLTGHYFTWFFPIAQQARQAVVPHHLSLKGAQVWDFDVLDFNEFFIMKSI